MKQQQRQLPTRCRCWRMDAAVLVVVAAYAAITTLMLDIGSSMVVVVEAFTPTIIHNNYIHMSPSSSSSSSLPSHAIIAAARHFHRGGIASSSSSLRRTHSLGTTTQLFMSDNNNYFDQTQYTDAAWSAIVGLPPCSTYYSSTSVDAPMLLSILLNPTKYQVPNIDNALTAKTVVTKLLTDAGVTNIDIIKRDVEKYLEKQPKVSGDTSQQKSLGRVLGEVLEAARGVKDGLKVRKNISYML